MAQYFNLRYDNTKPVLTGITGITSPTNSTLSLTITYGTEIPSYRQYQITTSNTEPTWGTTWETWSAALSVSGIAQGTNYIWVRSMDAVGNVSTAISASFVWDTVAPSDLGYTLVADGETVTPGGTVKVRQIEVTPSATEETSGIAQYALTIYGPNSTSTIAVSEITWASGAQTITLPNSDGTYYAKLVVTDNAGNTAEITNQSFVILSRDSSVTFVITNSSGTQISATNSSTIYGLITVDSDISSYEISGDITTVSGDWTSGETSKSIALTLTSANGSKTITGTFTLLNGDTKTVTQIITYDNVGPTITNTSFTCVEIDGAQYGRSDSTVTTTGTVSDLYSGIKFVYVNYHIYDKNGDKKGETQTLKATISGNTFSDSRLISDIYDHVDEDIQHSDYIICYVLAYDGLYNTTTKVIENAIQIDVLAPTVTSYGISGTSLVSNYYRQIPSITITFSDDTPILDEFTINGEIIATKITTGSSNTYSLVDCISSDGYYTLTGTISDKLNNKRSSISLGSFIYDSTAPTVTSAAASKQYINARNATLTNIIASDASSSTTDVSGVYQMKLWGDITSSLSSDTAITENSASWETFATSKDLVVTSTKGNKTVYIKVRDKAGNESSILTLTNIFNYDPEIGVPSYSSDFATYTTDTSGTIEVSIKDDNAVTVSIIGDITNPITDQGITNDGTANSISLTLDTSSGGAKYITLTFKDAAGNTQVLSNQLVTNYDDSDPTVTVGTPDYDTISLQHTIRQGTTNKYYDTITVTWTPNEPIIEYKVSVWGTGDTPAEAKAISSVNGSENVAGTFTVDTASSDPITTIIMGADLAAHAHTIEGLNVIIVYVKDRSNRWSAIYTG